MAYLRSRGKASIALLMLMMFILPIATPLSSADADAAARNVVDIRIGDMTLDGGGSAYNGSQLYVENATHTINVDVSNSGSISRDVIVYIYHKGSQLANEILVAEEGPFSIGSQQEITVLIQWTASPGNDQELIARTSIGSDEDRLPFNVRSAPQYNEGRILSYNLPSPGAGNTVAVIPSGQQTFDATVLNTGVKDYTARMRLTFTNVLDNTNIITVEDINSEYPVSKGSIKTAPIPTVVAYTMDPASAGLGTDVWTLKAEVILITSSGNLIRQVGDVVDVRFSDYAATLTTPANRSTEPGSSTTLNYWLTVTGSQSDSFAISVTSINGWATLNTASPTALLNSGEIIPITVTVNVPANAANALTDTVRLTVTSQDPNGPPYTLTAETVIMASESYIPLLVMPNTVQYVIPGEETSFNATIQNLGNSDGAFELTAGFSSATSRWNVRLGTYNTGVINATESGSFSVHIEVPKLKMPLDPVDHNAMGDTVSVWVQAIPVLGGTPVIQSANLEVSPIIVIDPGVVEETIDLTVADVEAARAGSHLDLASTFNIEVLHNFDQTLVDTIELNGNITYNKSFTPLNNGGFEEASRWDVSLTNNFSQTLPMNGIKPNMSLEAALGIAGPDDDYPLAGTLKIPFQSNISRVYDAVTGVNDPIPGLVRASVSRNITINIPSVQEVDIVQKGPFNIPLANETLLALELENTGNDLASYRLSIVDDLPEGWVARVSSASSTVDSLEADIADWPSEGGLHIRDFDIYVTTDDSTAANSLVDVNVKVEDLDTGIIVAVIPVTVRVGPSIDLELSPLSQTVDINTMLGETPLARVFITNTGNTPTSYTVELDESESGEVNFTLESPNEILIAPGYTEAVKVRLSSSIDADSAGIYRAFLIVSYGDDVNRSAEIIGNVSEQSDLSIDAPNQIGVLPGQEQVVDFTVINSGNLVETFDVDASVESGWTVVPQSQQMTLSMDEENQGSVTVTVPNLGDEESLTDGSVHLLHISIIDQETDLPVAAATVRMVISPMFILDSVEWPDYMQYHRQWERTFTATVVNVGNRDVTADLDYSVNAPGGVAESDKWSLAGNVPTSLFMPVGQNVSFSFVVSATDPEPVLSDFALLSIQFTPRDTSVDGLGFLNSTLNMSRFFESEDIDLRPDVNDGPIDVDITYSHIPVGTATDSRYEIELCKAERLYDFAAEGYDESEYPWSFTLVLENQEVVLPLDPDGCRSDVNDNEHRYPLGERAPWEITNPLRIRVDAPDRPNIIPEDGWDLTFRLFNEDNASYTIYNESTFTFQLDVFADPSVAEVWISSGSMEEGTDATVSARIRNDGTAQALFFRADLACTASTVHTQQEPILQLGPNEEVVLNWAITSHTIDWWRQSIDGTCIVSLDASMISTNVDGNDRYEYKDEVYSWSPGQSSSFVAFIIFGLLSLVLARLNGQNEKFRLFSTYAGILAFGFAFHLFNIVYWGPAVLLIAALWLWRMTWMSTDEFRLIHEDYQRARKGVSTLYADHFQALADSRRQLRIILALPVFGLLGVVLGIPPQIDTSQNNLLSIAAYVVVLSIGVSILVRRADSMYGALYGRLTDIEVKAIRIERDLSDPARLLNDLANDGINLDAIFDDLQSGVDLATEEEVSDDV